MGRTGLRGRGDLSYFGPNHTLQPVLTRGVAPDEHSVAQHPTPWWGRG